LSIQGNNRNLFDIYSEFCYLLLVKSDVLFAIKFVIMSQTHGHGDVLIGLQYGDEGKARIVDLYAKNYDIVARFNGGANAGHSVDVGGIKVALNQIPSGIFYPEKTLYIGSGCVVNVVKLAAEIRKIEEIGISLRGRLRITSQASIIQPQHQLIDGIIGKYIGTTKNGIGLCYADRAIRMVDNRLVNIRLADLCTNLEVTLEKIRENLFVEQGKYGFECDVGHAIGELRDSFEFIREFVELDPLYLQKKVENGQNVLFEGAQSVMLDPVKGAVPYVTSSHTIAAAAFVGGDLSLRYYGKTIGVAKVLMSRVGHGPFASELGGRRSEEYTMATNDEGGSKYTAEYEKTLDIKTLIESQDEFEVGQAMRVLSNEYGVVTRRPRRIGNLDLVQLKYACRINNVDELVLTKVDLLCEYAKTFEKKIPMVSSYILDGQEIDYIPTDPETYYTVKTKNTEFEAFSNDISQVRNFDLLPGELKNIVGNIEEFCNCRITGLGVGPERDEYIEIG
jgi:adenylosuccinate synthase